MRGWYRPAAWTTVQRRMGGHLVAEVQGNLAGLLRALRSVWKRGAGSPSPALSSWPLVTAMVA